MRWVRRFWDEESTWFYFELDDEGQVTRQIEVQDPAKTPIAAASLSEWFTELEAGRIQQYRSRFGVVADQPVTEDEIDDYEAIAADAFERLWREARSYLSNEAGGRSAWGR